MWDAEPFSPKHLTFAPEGSSAWPPSRAKPFFPLLLFFQFSDPSKYNEIRDIAYASGARLQSYLRSRGDDLKVVYPNFADSGASVENMYGKNLPRLKTLRKRYDPQNVMGLTGGWRF